MPFNFLSRLIVVAFVSTAFSFLSSEAQSLKAEAIVKTENKFVFCPVDQAASKDLDKAVSNKDVKEAQRLVVIGRVLMLKPGTEVSFVKRGMFSSTIWVLSGPNSGKTCIIDNSDFQLK